MLKNKEELKFMQFVAHKIDRAHSSKAQVSDTLISCFGRIIFRKERERESPFKCLTGARQEPDRRKIPSRISFFLLNQVRKESANVRNSNFQPARRWLVKCVLQEWR